MQITTEWHVKELSVQMTALGVVYASRRKHLLPKLVLLMIHPGMPKSKLVASVTLVTEGQTAQERNAHQEMMLWVETVVMKDAIAQVVDFVTIAKDFVSASRVILEIVVSFRLF